MKTVKKGLIVILAVAIGMVITFATVRAIGWLGSVSIPSFEKMNFSVTINN